MNKRERVDAALRGQPVDRVPISFWGHDYLREWSAEGLASAMLENYRRYDWDYMKVNPRASYHVEDWGAELKPSGDPNKGPLWIRPAVTTTSDWRKLRPLEPDRGVLGEQLEALRLIRDGLAGEAYFIQTIFSPLSIAKYLVGNDPAPVKAAIAERSRRVCAPRSTLSPKPSSPTRWRHWRLEPAVSSSPPPAGRHRIY